VASGEARRARSVPAVLPAREPHPGVRPPAPAGVMEARVATRPPVAAADRPLGTAVFLPVPAVLPAREPHQEVRPPAPAGVLEARVAARPPVAAADRPLGTAVFLPVPAAGRPAGAAARLSAAAEQSEGAVAPARADRRRQGDQPGPAVPPVPPVARQGRASGARLEGAVNWERGAMPEPAVPAAAATPGRAAHQPSARRGLPGPAVSSTPQTASETQATATRINCGSVEDPDP